MRYVYPYLFYIYSAVIELLCIHLYVVVELLIDVL